jgi:hypothetical protein
VFETFCFVWTTGLPEWWLKIAPFQASFLLAAGLHLAYLTPAFSFPHPGLQVQSAQSLAGFACPVWNMNCRALLSNTQMGSEKYEAAIGWLTSW